MRRIQFSDAAEGAGHAAQVAHDAIGIVGIDLEHGKELPQAAGCDSGPVNSAHLALAQPA